MEGVIQHCKSAFEYFASIDTEPIFKILISKWSVLTEIADVLKIVYDATIAIQIPHFTLSDLFRCWIRIHVRLERMKKNPALRTGLVNTLLMSLQARKIALLKHPAMLCAIYLDPRVYKELSEGEIKIAKIHLADLSERIFNLKTNMSDSIVSTDSIEEYFSKPNTHQSNIDRSDTRADFMQSMDNFRLSLPHESTKNQNKTIFEFWESKKELYPALYEVACAINGIPPSQVTVERSFSALSFLYSNKRSSLKQETLEQCLMIKLNAGLALTVHQDEMDELKKNA